MNEAPGQNPAVTSLAGSVGSEGDPGSELIASGGSSVGGEASEAPGEAGQGLDSAVVGNAQGGSASASSDPAPGGSASTESSSALGGSPPIDDQTMQDFEPMGVGGDASATFAEQGPPTCHGTQCATGEICNPEGGCEPACEVAGGVDAKAAWPLGGGCATRRGLSRYAGSRTPHELWRIEPGGSPTDYQSALTLGPNHTTYTAYYDAYQGKDGFLQLSPSGHVLRRFEDWLAPCPVIADGGVLLTVPGGLRATSSSDGSVLWEVSEGPGNQSGELAVGADGTIYVPGVTGVQQLDTPSLFAISKNGDIKWHFDVHDRFSFNTWPALASDGTIYFGDGENTLHALDPQGQELWQAPEATLGRMTVGPDGNVYSTYEATLLSFDAQGHERWRVDAFDWQDARLDEIAIGPDHTLYVSYVTGLTSQTSSGIQAYTPNGELKWAFTKPSDPVTAPVVDRDGIVYFGQHERAYAVNPDGSLLWEYIYEPYQDGATAVAIGSDGTTYLAFRGRLAALHDAPAP